MEVKMKRLIAIFVVMLLLLTSIGIAFAQEDTDTAVTDAETVEADATSVVDAVEATEEVATDAADSEVVAGTEEIGTTPDSPIWGLKRAIENINLALTFDNSKKVEKRLRYAQRRLLEVEAMMKRGDFKNAAKSEKAHARLIADASEDVDKVEDAEGETKRVKEFKSHLNKNIEVLERVKAKLEEKGVVAPGIEKALAVARARAECRQEIKEIVEAGEADEKTIAEAKAECREEIKTAVAEAKVRIREEFKERDGKRILERKVKVKAEEDKDEVETEEKSESETESTSDESSETESPEETTA